MMMLRQGRDGARRLFAGADDPPPLKPPAAAVPARPPAWALLRRAVLAR